MFIDTTTEPRQASELIAQAVAPDQFGPREMPYIVRFVVFVVPLNVGVVVVTAYPVVALAPTKFLPFEPVIAFIVATPLVTIIAFTVVVDVVPVVAATTPIRLFVFSAATGETPPLVVKLSLTEAPRNPAVVSTVAYSFVEFVKTLVS